MFIYMYIYLGTSCDVEICKCTKCYFEHYSSHKGYMKIDLYTYRYMCTQVQSMYINI